MPWPPDPDWIYVVDLETTGLEGGPEDDVVEIGIVAVDVKHRVVKDVYSSYVGHDVDAWPERKKNAWIFEKKHMHIDHVRHAPPLEKVMAEVSEILEGQRVTSYNTAFDLERFLYQEPWNMEFHFHEMPCIMRAALRARRMDEDGHLPLKKAFRMVSPHGFNNHRAKADAVAAARLLTVLAEDGFYNTELNKSIKAPLSHGDITFRIKENTMELMLHTKGSSRIIHEIDFHDARSLGNWLTINGRTS